MKKSIWVSTSVIIAGSCLLNLFNQSPITAQESVQSAVAQAEPQPVVPQTDATTSVTPPAIQRRFIKKIENGRVLSVQYKLKKAKKILGVWSLYEHALENDKSKMQYYNISVAQKDALLSEVYNLCSESGDSENEFCNIYPELVTMLGPIPDLVPGKWMQK